MRFSAVPWRAWVAPDDRVGALIFLASDPSTDVIGAVVPVDGDLLAA